MLFGNPANVSYATEYPIDKIVGIYTGSYDKASQTIVLGGFLYQYKIPHSFTRPIFCELLWSTTGLENSYTDGGASGAIAYSDSNNIYITTTSNSGMLFYKVIASWIDKYDTNNPLITPVLNTTNKAYFDSRQNYQKIFSQDVISSQPPNTPAILHNLGYTPNCKVFFESIAGQVWPQIDGGSGDIWLYDLSNQLEIHSIISTFALTIVFSNGPAVNRRVWYKIYLDQ
jgi:hypothetical protein